MTTRTDFEARNKDIQESLRKAEAAQAVAELVEDILNHRDLDDHQRQLLDKALAGYSTKPAKAHAMVAEVLQTSAPGTEIEPTTAIELEPRVVIFL